jgi:hypothetical protein
MCGGLFGCCMWRTLHIRFAMPGMALMILAVGRA